MGIRIHKSIGWGLKDLKFDKENHNELIDERINLDILKDNQKLYDKFEEKEDFVKWLTEKKEECAEILYKVNQRNIKNLKGEKLDRNEKRDKKHEEFNITYILLHMKDHNKNTHFEYKFIYDQEFGDPSVMLFIPIDTLNWSRYDNTIDYYDHHGDDLEPQVKDISHYGGIFPWLGMEHIPGSPKYDNENLMRTYNVGEYNQLIGEYSKTFPSILKGEDLEYFKKYYRPVIAPSVILFAKWLNIFNDFYKTIHELRPMIYTYWG